MKCVPNRDAFRVYSGVQIRTSLFLADCYEDIGYTGDDSQRPALQRLLRDYASGKFAMVLVVGRDRLFYDGFQQLSNLPFPILSARAKGSNEHEV